MQFDYPSVLDKVAGSPAYVRSSVRIELGARSDHWPAQNAEVTPYIGQDFPDLDLASHQVRVLVGERTFWEKATILHALYHRPLEGFQPKSLSRHYYDLVLLARGAIGKEALKQFDLLEAVAAHKTLFFRSAWAHYESARLGTLRLAPHDKLAEALRPDYANMRQMIFDDVPSFDRIMEELKVLEGRINSAASR